MPDTVEATFLEDGRLDLSEPIPASYFQLSHQLPTKWIDDDADDNGRIAFRMRARSSEPVIWWGWKLYHDFEGMNHKPVIPIDFMHMDHESIGFGDTFEVGDEGLDVAGMLTPDDDDPADYCKKLVRRGRNGVPYEASIYFGGPMVTEEVDEGMTATVNGEEIEGPAIIFRQWTLKAVAVCPHGKDSNTSTQFRSADDELISLTFSETPVTKAKLSDAVKQPGDNKPGKKQTDDTPPADPKLSATPDSDTPDTKQTAGEKTGDEPPAAEDSKPDAELKQYCGAFGHELGSKYFLDGLPFADAQAKYQGHREEQWAAEKKAFETKLSEKDARIAELEKKLGIAQDQLGDDPLEASDDATTPDELSDDRPLDAVGKFASGMKLPSKK